MFKVSMKSTISACALSLGALFIAQPLAAETVIYDNGAGGASGINGLQLSDADAPQATILADNFTLGQAATVTGFRWTGAYQDNVPANDSFAIVIHSDANGLPGQVLSVSFIDPNDLLRVDSGIDLFEPNTQAGGDVYDYSTSVSGLALDGSTTYWLSIVNNTSNGWMWGNIGSNSTSAVSSTGGQTWSQQFNSNDFRLTSVPEPSLAAFSSLIGGVALLRRKRRSSKFASSARV